MDFIAVHSNDRDGIGAYGSCKVIIHLPSHHNTITNNDMRDRKQITNQLLPTSKIRDGDVEKTLLKSLKTKNNRRYTLFLCFSKYYVFTILLVHVF